MSTARSCHVGLVLIRQDELRLPGPKQAEGSMEVIGRAEGPQQGVAPNHKRRESARVALIAGVGTMPRPLAIPSGG